MPASVEPVVLWVSVGVAGSFLLFITPKIWAWIVKALGKAIVESLENQLAPSWQADLEDLLDEKLSGIYKELSLNGGGSVKDLAASTAYTLKQMQRDIEPMVARFHKRYDDPDGTPI